MGEETRDGLQEVVQTLYFRLFSIYNWPHVVIKRPLDFTS